MGKCRICGLEAGLFRKVHKACLNKPLKQFIGSKKSKKYHTRTCRFVKGDPNLFVEFESIGEAIHEGYKPCKVCKPNEQLTNN
jgi:methylphosphotriester-DNA--protein-cysteine methyltransferase